MNKAAVVLRGTALAGVMALAACTYQGPDAEAGSDPVRRSLTWFSYLAGDDIRAACKPGTADHYRFVYNGIYQKQIRGYELRSTPAGTELTVRVRGAAGEMNRFTFDNPFGPWQMVASQTILDSAASAQIVASFQDVRAAAPLSVGQQYASNSYYWLVARCAGGEFALDVFGYPQVNINDLTFARLLLAHDTSGEPLRKAAPVEGMDQNVFYIRVNNTGDGLAGRL